jgi:hypothetical protein
MGGLYTNNFHHGSNCAKFSVKAIVGKWPRRRRAAEWQFKLQVAARISVATFGSAPDVAKDVGASRHDAACGNAYCDHFATLAANRAHANLRNPDGARIQRAIIARTEGGFR